MSSPKTKILEEVEHELLKISEKFNIPYENVLSVYNQKYEWVSKKLEGYDQKKISLYALKIAKSVLGRLSKLVEYEVLVLGWKGERMTKKGRKVNCVFAYMRRTNTRETEKSRILFFDEFAERVGELMPCTLYKMTLNKTGDFYVTTQDTTISDPRPINLDVEEIYNKLGFRKFYLRDIFSNVSNVDENGYVDEWDLKYCDAVIVNSKIFKNEKTGIERGVCTISDETIYEVDVTPDGKVLPSAITVWTSKEFAVYDEGSLVKVLGNVVITGEDEPQINAISVIPIDNLYEVREE